MSLRYLFGRVCVRCRQYLLVTWRTFAVVNAQQRRHKPCEIRQTKLDRVLQSAMRENQTEDC